MIRVICILWELGNRSVIKFHGGGLAKCICIRHFSLDIRELLFSNENTLFSFDLKAMESYGISEEVCHKYRF